MAEYNHHCISDEDFDGKLTLKLFKCKPAISLIQKYNTRGYTSSDQARYGNQSICADIYATGKFGLYDRFDPEFVLVELDKDNNDRIIVTLFRDTKKLLKYLIQNIHYELKEEEEEEETKIKILSLFTFKGEPVDCDLILKLTEKNRDEKQHTIEFKILR